MTFFLIDIGLIIITCYLLKRMYGNCESNNIETIYIENNIENNNEEEIPPKYEDIN